MLLAHTIAHCVVLGKALHPLWSSVSFCTIKENDLSLKSPDAVRSSTWCGLYRNGEVAI